MGGENKKEECEGIKMQRRTDKDIKQIRELISEVATNSTVNKTSLEFMSTSLKNLASANSLTHFKLFARTEKLRISVARVETLQGEREKHDTKDDTNKKHRHIFIVSIIAIVLSIITLIVLAKNANLF